MALTRRTALTSILRAAFAGTLLCFAVWANAALSAAQLQQLKVAIAANPVWAAMPNTQDGALEIAAQLSVQAVPDWIVRRTTLSRHSILTGTSLEATSFTWTGLAYIGRSQGERDAFREIFNSTGTVDPGVTSTIAAFADIFSGAGGATNRAHIDASGKRKASLYERVFTTGLGTLASPAILGTDGDGFRIEGVVNFTVVFSARNAP